MIESGEVASGDVDERGLVIDDLAVAFAAAGRWVNVVEDVSLRVAPGTTVGLVGESGSGKSMTALAAMGLLPWRRARTTGSIRLNGRELVGLPERQFADVRGRELAMVFQAPMSTFNPAFTIGEQIAEVVRRHEQVSRADAWMRAVECLDIVSIPRARQQAGAYPHMMSGGMLQRAAIAMAISCRPSVLLADEPTTALDVTVQMQILQLLRSLQSEFEMGILLVTHDLGVVSAMCDETVVLYAGHVMETGSTVDVLGCPTHPYTAALLGAVIEPSMKGAELSEIPGRVPLPTAAPPGCRFAPRCVHAISECSAAVPALVVTGAGATRCMRADELELAGLRDEEDDA
jgi:oligopeptide/dipeptide ABC transporter ATP-binding protein